MSTSGKISVSIVIYQEDKNRLLPRLNSLLKSTLNLQIFLIDNSPYPTKEFTDLHPDLTYIFNDKNLGFGRAHNLIIPRLTSDFHLILNPDVDFDPEILTTLINKLSTDEKLAFITPRVLNTDQSVQFLCRKHPKISILLNRRLKFSNRVAIQDEYREEVASNRSFHPEFIHGCFMLFKTDVFKSLGGFDERYFLYMEDADLCRTIEKQGLTSLYYPEVYIVHEHRRASTQSFKLLLIHLYSSFLYFLKWGVR